MRTKLKLLLRQAAQAFGGIDILINNASAINLTSLQTEATPAKRFDLMFDVNVRGTFYFTGCYSTSARSQLRQDAIPTF
jgi:citronellol/citronellal dehydrogenase